MTVLGISATYLAIIIVLCIIVIAVSLVRLYAQLSCGYYHGQEKMDGKTVIITGANGGIGKETAKEIARRGARVIMACRNQDTGKQARDEIIESTKNVNVVVKKLDLSSQKSIREFAEDILKNEPELHILIHNAATAETKFSKTEDDLELNMATNHFGPFLLTHLLIDLLKQSAPSRIVIVASSFYRVASLNLNSINPSRSNYIWYYYFVSKYANISFTFELARRLEGTNVTANCLHPGLIDTRIWKNMYFPLNLPLILINKLFFKNPVQGSQTTIFLACSKEVEGVSGKYFSDCAMSSVSSGVKDESKAKKLWELCEKFANLKDCDPKIHYKQYHTPPFCL